MVAGHPTLRNIRAALFSLIILALLACDVAKPVTNSDTSLVSGHSNSTITDGFHKNIPTDNIFRNDTNNKKIFIILTFLGLSVAGAIVLSFVNVHYDFLELRNFYRGYMGRRLLIQEGRLLTKTKHKAPKDAQFECSSPPMENGNTELCNGGVRMGLLKLDDVLSPVTTTSLIVPAPEEVQVLETSLMELSPAPAPAPLPDLSSVLGIPAPRRYVEDDGPEWRELDYLVEVGTPPPSFCLFYQQYDWNVYSGETLTEKEIEERKNLLNQFRKWKKRKRKVFNIVVTERSRREMAEQEEEKNKKRSPPKA